MLTGNVGMHLAARSIRVGGTTWRTYPRSTGLRYTATLFLFLLEVRVGDDFSTPVFVIGMRRHKRARCRVQTQISDRGRYHVDVDGCSLYKVSSFLTSRPHQTTTPLHSFPTTVSL
jgi:hypothetical protein